MLSLSVLYPWRDLHLLLIRPPHLPRLPRGLPLRSAVVRAQAPYLHFHHAHVVWRAERVLVSITAYRHSALADAARGSRNGTEGTVPVRRGEIVRGAGRNCDAGLRNYREQSICRRADASDRSAVASVCEYTPHCDLAREAEVPDFPFAMRKTKAAQGYTVLQKN